MEGQRTEATATDTEVLACVREFGSATAAMRATTGGGVAVEPGELGDSIARLIVGVAMPQAIAEAVALGYLLGRKEAPEPPPG